LQITSGTLLVQRVSSFDNPALTADQAVAEYHTATTWPSNVTSVVAVALDSQGAMAAIGTPGAVSDNVAQVILFQMTGDFIARGASTPPGGKAPTSTVLQLIYDPATNNVIGSGYVDSPSPLSGVGMRLSVSK